MADNQTPSPSQPPQIRQLFVNMMFSMLVSLVVFAVATYFFLVPQMAMQQLQLSGISARVDSLASEVHQAADEVAAAEETAEPAADQAAAPADTAAPAPAAPADSAAPAPAPAPAPEAK